MAKKKMTPLAILAYVLLIIGGINWGLTAFLETNVVSLISMGSVVIEKIIYGAVAASGIYGLINLQKLL